MPIHDWTKVPEDLAHHFRRLWSCELCDRLNAGGLPAGYMALVERRSGEMMSDEWADDLELYSAIAPRIRILTNSRRLVAMIEWITTGDYGIGPFSPSHTQRLAKLLGEEIHLVLVDLTGQTEGDHGRLPEQTWNLYSDGNAIVPRNKPFLVASYRACRGDASAIFDLVAAGERLPDGDLSLNWDTDVPIPLDETYQATWSKLPGHLKEVVMRSHA